MPSFIVKPKPDEDFYVEWSTIGDAPLKWGTRQDALDDGIPEERLARADDKGTSMCDPDLGPDEQWFGWSDDSFIVMEVDIMGEREGGSYSVPRANVRAMCELLEHDKPVPTDLLEYEPWDD